MRCFGCHRCDLSFSAASPGFDLEEVPALITGDGQEPGREHRTAAEAGGLGHQEQEDLLGDVARAVGVAAELPAGGGVDEVEVPLDQRRERVPVAGGVTGEEFGIGGSDVHP